jgi:ankyrin repeat protein
LIRFRYLYIWIFCLGNAQAYFCGEKYHSTVDSILILLDDQLDHTESSFAYPNRHQNVTFGDPTLSSKVFPYSSINRPDSSILNPLASDSQAANLRYDATFTHGNGDLHQFNDPQASLRSIPSIPGPSTFVQEPPVQDFEFQIGLGLDFNSPAQLGEANLEFRSQDIASNPVDVDSGYYSVQNQANMTSPAGIISHLPFHPNASYFDPSTTVEKEPEAEHGTSQTVADLYTRFKSPMFSKNFPKRVSILHIVPCKRNHTAVGEGLSTTCECGVRQVHVMCMRIPNLNDHQILEQLKWIHDKGGVDGAGNTALHYIAETGRRQALDYMLNFEGVDIQCRNALGQNFLHVLDGTGFGDELASFLWKFKGFGLLDQRDHHGRTVLHGLLRHPIKPSVCREIREMYGPTASHHFALRDNEGKDAVRYLRDLSKQMFPFAPYAYSDYAQTIVLLENDVKSFIVGYSAVDESHPRTRQEEERGQKQVLCRCQGVNTEDPKGKNALHCLAYWPTGHTSDEEGYRVHQITQALVSGVDVNSYDRDGRTPLITHICQSPLNEEESAIHSITALLTDHGANVQMVDRNGHSALYHALQKGFSNCVAILVQHGARVNYRAADGSSLRMIAEKSLLEHLSASDEEGRRKLKHCLLIMSVLNDRKAALNPTPLEERGIP